MVAAPVVVVGGRGFIGSAIVARLRAAGVEVVSVTHSREHASKPGFRYGDLLLKETLPRAIEGAAVVIQSANFRSYPIEHRRRGQTYEAFDAEGTERLVRAAEAGGVQRYVFIAGAGTWSGGDKPYWDALRRGESCVLDSRLDGVCVEPTLVFGPNDRSLNRMIAFARKAGFVPVVGSGESLHQPVFVEDVAELVFRSLAGDARSGVFAIGGPERMTMNELVRRTLLAAGLRRPIVRLPDRYARFAAALARHFPGEPLSSAAIEFMLENFTADIDPIRHRFGIVPRSLDEGLQVYLGGSAVASGADSLIRRS